MLELREKMIKQPIKGNSIFDKFSESYAYLKLSWGVQTKIFFKDSTLHGVKYISASDRPFFERFLWFLCVTTGTIATFVVIFSLWDKFQTNPTITGLDTDVRNWHVLFPSIILCPEKPASFEKIKNYLGISSNQSYKDQEKIQFLDDISKLSINTLKDFDTKYRNGIPQFFNTSEDLRKLVFNLMSECDDQFDKCKYKNSPIKCCETGSTSFNPMLTEIGICYAFNAKHFEKKISGEVQFNMQYILETDTKWALEFSMRSTEILNSIYIEHPDEMIELGNQPHIWDYSISAMTLSVKSTYTTENTRQLSMKQRKCVFQGEVELKIDETYTYTACSIQCRMEIARARCGCVPFFYPKIAGYKYCSVLELTCLAKNLVAIIENDNCNCLLSCSQNVYDVEGINTTSSRQMEIKFISWPMIRYKREVLFGWVDLLGGYIVIVAFSGSFEILFLVSFGGIAGLFLGFSLLSAAEIIYYFTLRSCIAAFKERKYLDKVRKENEEKIQPPYDLSLVPYFISQPLPGHGMDLIVQKFNNRNLNSQKSEIFKKTNKIHVAPMPPFGLEFVN